MAFNAIEGSLTSAPYSNSTTAALAEAGPVKPENNTDGKSTGNKDRIFYSYGLELALIMGASYLAIFW